MEWQFWERVEEDMTIWRWREKGEGLAEERNRESGGRLLNFVFFG
jgi:hypothetical protein